MTLHLVCDNTATATQRPRHCFANARDARAYIMGGNATITVVSKKTGKYYTYKVKKPNGRDTGRRFVGLLSGPDNEDDYTYLGLLENGAFRLTSKSKMTKDSIPVRVFRYAVENICGSFKIPDDCEVWHEGSCAVCGRKLTVPESLERGIGPECAAKLGLA